MAVSSCNKATKVIDGIRERYNTSILYEQSDPQKDCENITFLHKRFPRVYIILVTEELQKENRKLYLQAGVNNTLSPTTHEGNLQQMTKFLQLRKEHKLQEFSQSHRKIFNTFHLPVWKRIFDILFAVAVLIALSPIFIVTAIAIRMESKGKVIYKSQRVGSNYQIFNFLKFRSMYTNADKRLKELNALNQYKMEEELTDELCHGTFENGIAFDVTQGFVYGQLSRNQTHNAYTDIIGTKGIVRMTHDFRTAVVELHGVNRTLRLEKPFGGKNLDKLCNIMADSIESGKRDPRLPQMRDSAIASQYGWTFLEDARRHDLPGIGDLQTLEEIRERRRHMKERT